VGGVAGHAGLFATAAEAAALGQAWLSRDPRLGIDGELMDMATQEQAETAGERRGLGWMMKSLKGSSAGDLTHPSTYGHTGFVGNSLFIDPTRDLVMATLANWVYFGRDRDGMIEFRRALHDLIAEAVDRA
jgi:CubicO group peptidase (beta-lactamase class C family)